MKKTLLTLLALFGLSLPVQAAESTIVVARGAETNSLDPAEVQSFEGIKCADWMYDGLVRFEGNSHKIVPALAESWIRSEDGLTWVFKLRKGVKFHDGTDFNADAVVFSFERQRDKTNPFYNNTFFRWNQKFDNVKVTRKIDDYTVEVILEKPSPTLLVNMALYGGYIISPTAMQKDKEGFRFQPVGTGYFRFVKWIKDDYMEFEANPEYWDGPPKVKRLIVKVVPDNDVRLLALRKGEVHIAYDIDFTAYDEVKSDPMLELHSIPTLGASIVSMNMERKPFDDVRVRQAIVHAVDRNRLFQTAFYGFGQPANQTLPPEWFGHNPDVKSLPYDPAKAKKLLAEAGVKNLKVDLIAWNIPRPYCPAPRDLATLIKTDLKKVGIDVNIRIMNWGTFVSQRAANNYDMALGGIVSGTPDPDGLVYQLWSVNSIRPPVERVNSANWRNKQGNEYIDQARSIYDEDQRADLYRKFALELDKDTPAIFVAHPISAIAARKAAKNLYIHDSTLVPLHKVSVEE